MTPEDAGGPREQLRMRLAQTAPRRMDVEHNRRTMEEVARGALEDGVDLLVFPELALTGYDLGDRAAELALDLRNGPGLTLPTAGPVVVYGLVERGDDALIHNAAVAARGRRILHVHRKIDLPTYGSFDEGRLFARGRAGPGVFEPLPGWRCGVLVCEELWHPANAYIAALRGADLLVVVAAPPGRGVPAGVSEGDGDAPVRRFASSGAWETLARATALVHGVWVVLVARVGVEGALTFAGGSLVVAPDGAIAARAGERDPELLDCTLGRAALRQARRSFSHLRDDDAGRFAREIDAILRGRS